MPALASRIVVVDDRNVRFARGERLNIAPTGKRFVCNFIEPGLVDYSDCGGDIELLRKETIDEALATLIGNPLTIGHVSIRINQSELNRLTRGKVDRFGYNEATGWFFCEGSVDDDHARDRLRRNAKPSVGYTVLEFGPGGVHHNIRYAREITKIRFHHLAIVDNPRYETADIRLNSKTKPIPAMSPIKWIKKILRPAEQAGGAATEVEETGTLPDDTVLELEGGKTVRLNEVIAAKVAADKAEADKKAADEQRDNALDGETMIEYAPGKTAKLNELTRCYATFGQADHCNETDDEKAAREAKEKTDRENATRRKEGQQSFRILSGARHNTAPTTQTAPSSNSLTEQLARGRERYGSVKTGNN